MEKTFEEIKKGLEGYISHDIARMNAWKNVTLNKKKDGTDFVHIGKSFTNAKVGDYYPVEDWFNPYLTVRFEYINENGRKDYGEDHMEIYTDEYAEYREKRSSSYSSYAHYILTPNEIMEKIEQRIKMFENYAEQHRKELNNAEALYNAYIPKIKKLMDDMKTKANELKSEDTIYNTSIYYMLRDCAESVVKSCY